MKSLVIAEKPSVARDIARVLGANQKNGGILEGTTGNGGMLLLALAVVVIGGGAGWYFKIYRPKKQRAAESEADYGGEYDGAEDYDETAPEDDGPPWDEDGEE